MMTIFAALFAAQAAGPAFPAPDCAAAPGWSQQGPERSYDPETLFDYMNGNSEGYFAYGFTLMKGVTCVNAAGDQLVIDVSEMGDPDRAWGFFVAAWALFSRARRGRRCRDFQRRRHTPAVGGGREWL